eukprot:1192551-Prorocentrum_minimum.AAC.3
MDLSLRHNQNEIRARPNNNGDASSKKPRFIFGDRSLDRPRHPPPRHLPFAFHPPFIRTVAKSWTRMSHRFDSGPIRTIRTIRDLSRISGDICRFLRTV